eukprot:6894970-Prymnesium_polylepis.1
MPTGVGPGATSNTTLHASAATLSPLLLCCLSCHGRAARGRRDSAFAVRPESNPGLPDPRAPWGHPGSAVVVRVRAAAALPNAGGDSIC